MAQPYTIRIASPVLDDLRRRLANTRWVHEIDNEHWETGTNAKYLKELCEYWSHDFDWNKNESYLNSFSHFKAKVDEMDIHFIHEKGKGENRIPLLLIHGYPDSFMRFLKVIPILTAAGEDGISFDLVIPSLPGYGFSQIPQNAGMNQQRIAALFTKLMTEELGYSKFMVHGGDWGSGTTEQMALNSPQYLEGIHLTDIPWYHLFTIPPGNMTEEEKKYLQAGQQWSQQEGAYALIQSTKPQTIAHGLNDSPAGLAGWLIDKFYSWSDCGGDLESIFSKDELLTNCTIYWATQTITSALRLYYEAAVALQKYGGNKEIKKIRVPTGVAIFPKDMVPAPRSFAERIFNVTQWTEMKKGGHFTAMEQPEMFAKDIRQFASSLQPVRA